jgi:hypothetical protein
MSDDVGLRCSVPDPACKSIPALVLFMAQG